MKSKTIKLLAILAGVILTALLLVVVVYTLVWNGVIILNGFTAGKYPVKGVDVSSYQGQIDWQELSDENISFAFMKATEGSSFVDKNFAYNFQEAQKTHLAVGAYHFFSYDSPGQTQAENFIETVQPYDGMLPPVIDLEFYGDKEVNPPTREYVDNQLKAMLQALEKHYGQKPIIYATEKSYALYLSGDYADYDIWIRNVLTKPELSDQRNWTFWQYTNREKLNGYQGTEEYIDMNVFNGSTEEFESYIASFGYQGEL
jgi:lysozyme